MVIPKTRVPSRRTVQARRAAAQAVPKPTYSGWKGGGLVPEDYLNELIDQARGPKIVGAEHVEVRMWRQENFTIATLQVIRPEGLVADVLMGVAKRNCYDDPADFTRGAKIALARAARGVARELVAE